MGLPSSVRRDFEVRKPKERRPASERMVPTPSVARLVNLLKFAAYGLYRCAAVTTSVESTKGPAMRLPTLASSSSPNRSASNPESAHSAACGKNPPPKTNIVVGAARARGACRSVCASMAPRYPHAGILRRYATTCAREMRRGPRGIRLAVRGWRAVEGVWSETLQAWSKVDSAVPRAIRGSARAKSAFTISKLRVKRPALRAARPARRGLPHVTAVERML